MFGIGNSHIMRACSPVFTNIFVHADVHVKQAMPEDDIYIYIALYEYKTEDVAYC